jgi:hypothetical protein
MCHAEHIPQLEAAHAAMAKLSARRELPGHTEVLCGALKRRATSADKLRENVMVCLPFLQFRISAAGNLMCILGPETRCQRHPSRPLSQSHRACPLLLEHPHLLEEHGADHVALHQREAGLVDAQAREVDIPATANALLQTTRVVERSR